MKSKIAEDFLKEHICGGMNGSIVVSERDVRVIVDFAEQEMEQKCIEAHCKMCRTTSNVTPSCKGCTFRKEFILILNKNYGNDSCL